MKKNVCLLLVLCFVFTLCACGEPSTTPFDNIVTAESIDDIEKAYGQDYETAGNSETKIIGYDYSWLGYNGQLEIWFWRHSIKPTGSIWTVKTNSAEQIEQVSKKITSTLDKKFGKNERDSETGRLIWYDIYSSKYTLIVESDHVSLAYHR